jgi:hypothetical protein
VVVSDAGVSDEGVSDDDARDGGVGVESSIGVGDDVEGVAARCGGGVGGRCGVRSWEVPA